MNIGKCKIREFLYDYRSLAPSESSDLGALIKAFNEFVAANSFPRSSLCEGQLPVSQFANWIARRFGISKKSIYDRWTRYDGSFWRQIESKYGNGKAGYDALYDLLNEFDRVYVSRTAKATTREVNRVPATSELEAWRLDSDEGYLLNVLDSEGNSKIEGFYSALKDLKNSCKQQYAVSEEDWQSC